MDAKSKAWHAAHTAKRNGEKKKFASVKDNKEYLLSHQISAYRRSECNWREMYTR